MIRSELSTSYREAGSPLPPQAEWEEWMGRALAAARGLASDGDVAGAAQLLADLREDLDLPAEPELVLVEARMRLRSGRPGVARSVLTDLLEGRPTHAGALRLRARVLASQGDLRGSIDDAIRVLDTKPDEDLLHSTLIRQQLIGDWDGAHRLLQQHRSTVPALDDAVNAAAAELGAEASAAALVALAIKPPHRRLPHDASPEELEAALPLLRADLDDEPSNARNWERFAAAQLAADRTAEAIASFQTLTDLEPLAEEAWFGLATAHLSSGDAREAMAAADRALALNPDSHRARMVRVEASAARPSPAIWSITSEDDRQRLVMETKDQGIASRLSPLLEEDDQRGAAALRALAGEATDAKPLQDSVGAIDGTVVYTVLTGGYEQPSDPRDVLGDEADVVVLTDDPSSLPAPMRPLARALDLERPAQLASRHPKMLPHLYFPDHEQSIYIDANFHLLSDPREMTRTLSPAAPMTVLAHSERATPVAEARLVVERGFASWVDVQAHFERQRTAGFDPSIADLSYGGFLVRRHHEPALIAAMQTWWDQFEHGVRRDQLSLDFALWSAGVVPTRLPLHNHRNPFWIRIPHV